MAPPNGGVTFREDLAGEHALRQLTVPTMARSDFVKLEGSIPIIPTPFQPNDVIDLDSLRDLVEFAAAGELRAICLPAYASEFYKLSEEEREQVVETALDQARGRVAVIAQCNHPSSRVAAQIGLRNQARGASVLAYTVPRQFPLGEEDIFRYFAAIFDKVSAPVLIQDFNPGGSTISASLVGRLHRTFPPFRYLKLEEPLMGEKIRAIHEATHGEVGVLEGWGGMYLLELIPHGICGFMPGLAISDLLQCVFALACEGKWDAAYDIFCQVLPQITFSLESMETFHHAEKRLLHARGILKDARVREATRPFTVEAQQYVERLNARLLVLLDELGMPRNPTQHKAIKNPVESGEHQASRLKNPKVKR